MNQAEKPWSPHRPPTAPPAVARTLASAPQVLPGCQTFCGDLPDANSNWQLENGDARASLFYPGPTATNAIPLICDQGLRQAPGAPCNPAPTFPLTVIADPR